VVECLEINENKTYKAQMFNRGQSAKVFKEAVEKDSPVCVIRNSEPYVAILKYESYIALIKKTKKYDELEEKKNAL
jgi:phd_YefM